MRIVKYFVLLAVFSLFCTLKATELPEAANQKTAKRVQFLDDVDSKRSSANAGSVALVKIPSREELLNEAKERNRDLFYFGFCNSKQNKILRNAIPTGCFYDVVVFAGGEALLTLFSVSKGVKRVLESDASIPMLHAICLGRIIFEDKAPLEFVPPVVNDAVPVPTEGKRDETMTAGGAAPTAVDKESTPASTLVGQEESATAAVSTATVQEAHEDAPEEGDEQEAHEDAPEEPQLPVNLAFKEGKLSPLHFIRAHYCTQTLVQHIMELKKQGNFVNTASAFVQERIAYLRQLGLDYEVTIFTHLGGGFERRHPLYLAAKAGDIRSRALFCNLRVIDYPLGTQEKAVDEHLPEWIMRSAVHTNDREALRVCCSSQDSFDSSFDFNKGFIASALHVGLLNIVQATRDEAFLVNFVQRILKKAEASVVDQVMQFVMSRHDKGSAIPLRVTDALLRGVYKQEDTTFGEIQKLLSILSGWRCMHPAQATREDCDLIIAAYGDALNYRNSGEAMALLMQLFTDFSAPKAPFIARVVLLGERLLVAQGGKMVTDRFLPAFEHDFPRPADRPNEQRPEQDYFNKLGTLNVRGWSKFVSDYMCVIGSRDLRHNNQERLVLSTRLARLILDSPLSKPAQAVLFGEAMERGQANKS